MNNAERLRRIRRRLDDQSDWPHPERDIRWLLSQLAIANAREQQLLTLINEAAEQLRVAPCQDVVRPIERKLRYGVPATQPEQIAG